MAFLRRGKTAYGEGRRVPSDKEGGRREKKKEEQWRGLRQGKLENGGEAKHKKGMEIKGKGEGLPRNAARAFILKSRWNKSAMRTWLKKTWEREEGKGLCRVSSSKEDPSSLLPELKSPG